MKRLGSAPDSWYNLVEEQSIAAPGDKEQEAHEMTTSENGHSSQERAYAYIRRLLETRPFRPGQEISEVQIAQALGTSRTPVREALRQIEREGLIVHTARKGWTIHVLEPEELAQVFDLKEVVDGLIARRSAANMTPELATRVEAAVANMERAALAQDGQAWVAADDALHELLLEACHNPRAGQLTSSLNAYWRRLWIGVSVLPERMDYSTREHRAIINAILAGDAAQAEFLMREHVARLKLYLLSVLTNVVLPFSQP